MKRRFFLAVLVSLILWAVDTRAEDTNAVAPTIGSAQATNWIGKQVVVTGVVAQVSSRPGLTFLNFDKRYPNSPFTAIIRARYTNEFENVSALQGKSVSVTGRMKDYNGKPEIELTSKSQLKVLSETK
jgi:DNA/RNA endonuclease YhcR with UshA esterase domain